MSETIRISAKNIGALKMPDACPRCLWIKAHVGNNLPFQIFPGIFSTIDKYSKRVTNNYYDKHRQIPGWFEAFGDLGAPIRVKGGKNFSYLDEASNVLLTGVPDEVFRDKNGDLFIADYKTARFTENADALLPIYEIQLNGYAVIAEAVGLGKVTGLGLLYYEPREADDCDVDTLIKPKGFDMTFEAKILPMELTPEEIRPLMMQFRELHDGPIPAGRTDCKDCKYIEGMFSLLR